MICSERLLRQIRQLLLAKEVKPVSQPKYFFKFKDETVTVLNKSWTFWNKKQNLQR